VKEREPLPAALGHAQPNNRRQPTAYRLHSCLAMSASSFCLSTHKSPGYCWSTPKYGNWCAQHAFFEGKKLNKFLREKSTSRTLRGVDQQYPPGYCWRIYFTVLAVLFLASVSQAFLPSKKAYWAHQFRYLGVGQQYPPGYCWSTLRIVLDDLTSDKPHLYGRHRRSGWCGMPLMRSYSRYLLQK